MVSSESTKAIHSPSAASSPALRAPLRPRFFWWMTRMRLSFAAAASHRAGQLSGEPSSTKISSKSVKVWARMESMHSFRYRSTLYTGTMMLISGRLSALFSLTTFSPSRLLIRPSLSGDNKRFCSGTTRPLPAYCAGYLPRPV